MSSYVMTIRKALSLTIGEELDRRFRHLFRYIQFSIFFISQHCDSQSCETQCCEKYNSMIYNYF